MRKILSEFLLKSSKCVGSYTLTRLRDYVYTQGWFSLRLRYRISRTKRTSQYLAVSSVKSAKCRFANLVVSRKIAPRPTNLEGLTHTEQGNPDYSDRDDFT